MNEMPFPEHEPESTVETLYAHRGALNAWGLGNARVSARVTLYSSDAPLESGLWIGLLFVLFLTVSFVLILLFYFLATIMPKTNTVFSTNHSATGMLSSSAFRRHSIAIHSDHSVLFSSRPRSRFTYLCLHSGGFDLKLCAIHLQSFKTSVKLRCEVRVC